MTQPAGDGFHRHFLVAAAMFCFVFFMVLGFWPPPRRQVREEARATEAFRLHHRKYHDVIAQISGLLDTIHHVSEMQQLELMAVTVSVVRGDLLPHARAEEQFLYPAADRRAGTDSPVFTATLRFEHRLLERWTEELAAVASEPFPDHNAFCLRGERLLGLLEAHLAAEEEVLLPMLDKTMTPEEFRREVERGMGIGKGALP